MIKFQLDDKTMNLVFTKLAQSVGKQFGVEPKVAEAKQVKEVKESKEKPELKAEVKENKLESKPKQKPSALDDVADFLARGK